MYRPSLKNMRANIEKFSVYSILIMILIIFSFLSMESLWHTCVFDEEKILSEIILYKTDNILLNIFILIATVFILYISRKYWSKINIKYLTIALYVYTLTIGLIWIYAVKSIPGADSYIVSNSAYQFSQGDYSILLKGDTGYFNFFPFQLGYTLFCQFFYTLLNPENTLLLQILNLISVCFLYGAFLKINRLLFNNNKIQILTIFLLATCLQPILFTTFVYGIIIGYTLAIWALVFEILYIKTNKKKYIILTTLLITLATIIKYNNMIVLTVIVITLFIHLIRRKKLFNIIAIALCIISTNVGIQSVVKYYENKADVNLTGIPMICWLNMGLNESSMAPGWYNYKYTREEFKNNDFDYAKTKEAATLRLKNKIEEFDNNPEYTAAFFKKKIVSQWNEPTYESIWISQCKDHLNEIPNWVESVYTESLKSNLIFYMSKHQELVFIFTFASTIYLIKKRKRNIIYATLYLTVLGGFLYHLLFEGKSQYILVYFVTCIPLAAYGLFNFIKSMGSYFQKKIGYINNDNSSTESDNENAHIIHDESSEKIKLNENVDTNNPS